MSHFLASTPLFRIALAALILGCFGPARSETLVASDIHTRLILAFRVTETPLQKWLPAGWQFNPPTSGSNKGANLILGFVDRLLNLDPDGKPIGGGRDRYLAISVPAKQAAGTQAGNIVLRVYTGNAQLIPGAYGTSVRAGVLREQSDRGSDVETGVATDAWEIRDDAGGVIEAKLQYRRGMLSRSDTDSRFFSPVQPDFFRIYRTQQGTDIVRSLSLNVDRVDSLQFKVTIAELRDLFDGTEQLLSITESPWSMRQIFLP